MVESSSYRNDFHWDCSWSHTTFERESRFQTFDTCSVRHANRTFHVFFFSNGKFCWRLNTTTRNLIQSSSLSELWIMCSWHVKRKRLKSHKLLHRWSLQCIVLSFASFCSIQQVLTWSSVIIIVSIPGNYSWSRKQPSKGLIRWDYFLLWIEQRGEGLWNLHEVFHANKSTTCAICNGKC